ncbi:hypothetical protein [Streptomyces sp. NPDC047042]|uniref:hypothetical protein n=1 Tax=Streptomyces sp. NPDC047042 TaxID=3154807 RepID=UPI0033F3CDD4
MPTPTSTDLDSWPFDDDTYALRQRQRDADTAAFATVRADARHLLATADAQSPHLPSASV